MVSENLYDYFVNEPPQKIPKLKQLTALSAISHSAIQFNDVSFNLFHYRRIYSARSIFLAHKYVNT